ncbi:MAG: hypothetical protein K2G37_02760 [Clostridia bacterium]|nr:hypothetical protein [Clostridia bacterium]MDE7328914.1 hypothetical protein [Clostridia bacterium]
MTKAKKAVVITVSVILALALIAGLILGLILWGIANAYIPEEVSTNHEYLQTVMADDVVYLSDDFVTGNSLEWQPLELVTPPQDLQPSGIVTPPQDVWLVYNSHKYDVPSYATERAKGVESYSYRLKSSEDYDGIPVIVGVTASVKNDRNNRKKYINEYGGYKYRYYVDASDAERSVYNIKTTPKKFKTCILTISIKIQNDSSYTDEQIKAREEEIFKSAVDNIVKYQG